jgi:hypothetical protein
MIAKNKQMNRDFFQKTTHKYQKTTRNEQLQYLREETANVAFQSHSLIGYICPQVLKAVTNANLTLHKLFQKVLIACQRYGQGCVMYENAH